MDAAKVDMKLGGVREEDVEDGWRSTICRGEP